MGSKTDIGRVGNLAVALGIGVAVFTGWGCAVAAADDGGGSPAGSDSTTHSDAGPTKRSGAPNTSADRTTQRSDRTAQSDTTQPNGDTNTEGDRTGTDDHSQKKRPRNDVSAAVQDDAEADVSTAVDEVQTAPDAVADTEPVTPDVIVPPIAEVPPVQDQAPAPEVGTDISQSVTTPVGHIELSQPDATDPLPAPAVVPTVFTLMGSARRASETEDVALTLDPTGPVQTTGLVQAGLTDEPIVYTAKPTFFDQLVVGSLQVMSGISKLIGFDIYGVFAKLLESDSPPAFMRAGLDVRQTDYQVADGTTWKVWEFHPPNPTGKTVVAIHGGGFLVQPLATNWMAYTNMARSTGATVLVPLYPLATTEAGSATKIVPATAQFISDQIQLHGTEDVSVFADSAGTILAMSALRQLVLNGDPVPASLVLLSPAPDASLSNPDIRDINDPVIDIDNLDFYKDGGFFAKGFDPKDPYVSPLFIENSVLAGMPPTTIYIGTLEIGLPDTLLFQTKWNAAGGAVSLVIGQGQIHDWALDGSINSQASQVRPDIYRQLGLNDVADGPTTIATTPPSFGDQLTLFSLRIFRGISDFIGVDLFTQINAAMSSNRPPFLTTLGLNVAKREYNGWTVWEIAPREPSGQIVVALHGGGFVYEPNLIHWSDYASMVRDTGATVLVPIYPLAPPKGTGTATTLIPPIADYISGLIGDHGAERVSVYGDSAGAVLGMLAVQEMVRRCKAEVGCDPSEALPSRMVLISPALNTDLSGPEVEVIDDPVLTIPKPGEEVSFRGGLDPDDPRVDPIAVADLTGLPPTTVYIGSLEKLYPGALDFRDKLLAQDPDADFTLVIGKGQIHDWALGGIYANSQAPIWRPNVYRQLGLLPDDVSAAGAQYKVQ